MDWETVLLPFVGNPITIWLEDISGEEKTRPQTHTLHHVKAEAQLVKLYLNDHQFWSIPVFSDDRTEIREEETEDQVVFVSRDEKAQLVYWAYLAN